jgi:hypothetical protein
MKPILFLIALSTLFLGGGCALCQVADATRCAGNNVEVCAAGAWERVRSCDTEVVPAGVCVEPTKDVLAHCGRRP